MGKRQIGVQGIVGDRACALRDLNGSFRDLQEVAHYGWLDGTLKWVNRSSLCKCGPRYAAS